MNLELRAYPWWLKPVVLLARLTELKVLTNFVASYQEKIVDRIGYCPSIGEIIDLDFLEPMGWEDWELAEKMGIDENELMSICMGLVQLDRPMAEKLATALNTTADFFLEAQERHNIYRSKEFAYEPGDF